MRLSNVIIGVLLAIALAYIHDASMSSVTAEGHTQNIVNWDVFGHLVSDAYDWIRSQLRMS